MANVNETPEVVETVAKTKPAKTNKNTVANLDAEAKKAKAANKLDKITDDGKKHKQGEVIKREAFGVVIETKF